MLWVQVRVSAWAISFPFFSRDQCACSTSVNLVEQAQRVQALMHFIYGLRHVLFYLTCALFTERRAASVVAGMHNAPGARTVRTTCS